MNWNKKNLGFLTRSGRGHYRRGGGGKTLNERKRGEAEGGGGGIIASKRGDELSDLATTAA